MTLYELTGQWAELYNMMETEDEEIMQAVKDTMESIDGEIDEKLENIGIMILSQKAEDEALKAEQDRIAKKRKTIQNKSKYLKQYALDCLKAINRKKGGGIRVTISRSLRRGASLDIADNAVIPIDYFGHHPPTIDRTALKEAVKNGLVVDGVTLRDSESVTVR